MLRTGTPGSISPITSSSRRLPLFSGSAPRLALPDALSSARQADSPRGARHHVLRGIRVPVGAMSLSGVDVGKVARREQREMIAPRYRLKVGWVDAEPISADVMKFGAVRYRADHQLVADPVCVPALTVVVKSPAPRLADAREERPAFVRSADAHLLHEAFDGADVLGHAGILEEARHFVNG